LVGKEESGHSSFSQPPAHDPLPGPDGLVGLSHHVHNLPPLLGHHVQLQLHGAGVVDVEVGVDQTGQDHLAVQVHHPGFRSAQRPDLFVGTHGHKAVVREAEGGSNREIWIDGIDLPVHIGHIRFSHQGSSLCS
jgi:hypothetical protein